MRFDGSTKLWVCVLALGLALAGCPAGTDEAVEEADSEAEAVTPLTEEELAEAQDLAGSLAESARSPLGELSFEDFKASVYKEPWEGGKYIVNGDTTIVDDKHLEEFYTALNLMAAPPVLGPGEIAPEPQTSLVVHQRGGVDAVWDSVQKGSLTYCVSDNFGADKDDVIAEMAAATGVWEAVAAVDFNYDATQDADCDAFNSNVVFDVRRVNVNGQYLARAFFPGESRVSTNVLIDESSFELDPSPPAKLNLGGILRHELGHALGFRHEHTRPNSGRCFEDSNWKPLTDYDPFSVMHYPQCNGLGDWSLTLTAKDENGAACLYSAAEGFEIDTSELDPVMAIACAPEVEDDVDPGTEQVVNFDGESVAASARDEFGPFAVTPGTVFKAAISGTGDPDLYVRFGLQATRTNHDCRPYLWGAEESCSLDVPTGESEAFVMVYGFAEGTYDLEVTHTPPVE